MWACVSFSYWHKIKMWWKCSYFIGFSNGRGKMTCSLLKLLIFGSVNPEFSWQQVSESLMFTSLRTGYLRHHADSPANVSQHACGVWGWFSVLCACVINPHQPIRSLLSVYIAVPVNQRDPSAATQTWNQPTEWCFMFGSSTAHHVHTYCWYSNCGLRIQLISTSMSDWNNFFQWKN